MMNLLPLQEEIPQRWLRENLPDWMFRSSFLLENWQWLGLAALILFGLILDKIVIAVLKGVLRRLVKRFDVEVEPGVLQAGTRPFGLLAMGIFWLGLLRFIGLPEKIDFVLDFAAQLVSVGAAVWGAYRLVDVLTAFLMERAKKTTSKFDDLLIPLVRKTLKIFIAVFGMVFVLSNVPNLNISSLMAGVGIGGLAFALAAKDAVGNLFGSLTVILDRPFSVGDWVVIGDVEGTVEEVGIRSTRLRTFYNSKITVPNTNLITAMVDNMGERSYRRWKANVGVTYGTPPDKIEAFCEGIRELVRRHPYTRKDYFHVYTNGFGPSSIDILLYIFHEVPDWSTELRERHRLILDIMRLAARLKVEFAFPTQTLYMARAGDTPEPPPLPEKATIESGVRQGRREGRSVAEGELGGAGVVPPPVSFQVPPDEDRGESAQGDEGE